MANTLTWQLAVRYFRGKRSGNAVPILSRISMVAIAVGSAAMIILFSVFNGFEGLVKDLYKAFYPDVKVTVAKGKFFAPDDIHAEKIKGISGVKTLSYVIEDNALAMSGDQQIIVTLKGIDQNYLQVNNIKPYIKEGRDSVTLHPMPTAILGLRIANELGADVNNIFSTIVLYYPDANASNPILNPESAFRSLKLKADGDFRVQDDFDSKYILAPIPAVQELLGEEGKISSLEISVDPEANVADIQQQIRNITGIAFKVETRYEQNKTLYMVMSTEKWAVYAILLLVLLIASFNMVGALSLLVLEKQKDIAILKAMGAEGGTIRKVFLLEGILWSLAGGTTGILLGVAICAGQQHYKWLKLEGSFIIDAYPVSVLWTDIVLVIATIIIVGLLASLFPAFRSSRAEIPALKST